MVGPNGLKPNLDKVGTVVNWPTPEMVSDMMGFLGLTNFFRRLIANYARIAAPLTDLTRNVEVKTPSSNWRVRKGAYKRALKTTSFEREVGARATEGLYYAQMFAVPGTAPQGTTV
jgi:hypothetical protein